jgi:hypothetical protein
MKTKYSHLLSDQTPCYELSNSDIEGHHDLCDLAKAEGHASLHSCLNDWNAWGETVAEVTAMLLQIRSETMKAFNIQKDGYLFLTGTSHIDGLMWASEEETSPHAYEEFESREEAMDFINHHEIAEAEIVECDSIWA